MKAKSFIKLVVFCIGLSFAFSSCKECIDCQYQYTDPETNKQETYQYDKFCGTSEDVEQFKKKAQSDARKVNGKLNCTEESQWGL